MSYFISALRCYRNLIKLVLALIIPHCVTSPFRRNSRDVIGELYSEYRLLLPCSCQDVNPSHNYRRSNDVSNLI